MEDRRDWGGGGDDPEENTQRIIERIWESLTDIRMRMDQQAPVPPVAIPPGDGETVPIAPVPPGVEVPFVAPLPPLPPVLVAEELVMQVEKFLRLQPPTYLGGPNPDTAEHWVHEIERVFTTMRCPAADRFVLATYQLRGFALEWWRLKMQTTFAASEERAVLDTPARVDANLCDLQDIGLPEGSSLTPFSFSLALFSCPCFPTASNGCRRLVGGSWNEDIPPYSGPKAARESYAALQQISAIPGHICMRPELQILPGHRRFSRVPWLAPMLELLPPASISHLKEWGLSTVLVLAKKYDKMVHVWDSVTALAERWHPQTHTFVFPTFEATVLLEELEIMLVLPRYQRGEELAVSYTVASINSWSILVEITTRKMDLQYMTSGMHVHLLPIAQWIVSQCKRKTGNYRAIAKAAAICICGVILFPTMDGAISFANFSIVDSISEGPFFGSIIALELWMGVHIQFRAMGELATECKTMINHPLAFRTELSLRLLGNEALVTYNPDWCYLQCGAARTVVPILSHYPPTQERKRGDEQDEHDVRSAIVHWEGCARSIVQAEVEEDEDVMKEYIEALQKKVQPAVGIV
ncbi:hypothetical protein Taro_041016 [Colocasia esculenta]|uniref:Aminotransferase-like plant mobile domain-containing protein n=1 Tax=Colocasia esculenta TaxID=4460 RepID=A0A843WS55_COLES|nr:hypothetical protein [Colocasia esculenta]